jgi:outer membrane protein TolC
MGLAAVLLAMAPAAWAQLAPAATADPTLGVLDAVRMALTRNAQLQVGTLQVENARGQLQESAGPFDTNLFAASEKRRTYTPFTSGQYGQFPAGFDTPAGTVGDFTSSTLGVSQMLRSGIVISPTISTTRTSDNLTRFTSDAQAVNRPSYALNVTVPLLKNTGRDAYAAAEAAAEAELEATRRDLAHGVSQTTYNVLSAYWNYVSAERTRAISADAETSAVRRAGDVERLIAADHVAAAQRDLVSADVAAKRSNRIAAEQALTEARSALARAIGLSAPEAFALPLPRDEYPEAGPAAEDVLNRLSDLRAHALDRREDLKSADLRLERARVLVEAFRRNLQPQFDVTFSLGSNGLKEGNGIGDYWEAFGSKLRGPNAGLSFNFQFPVQNNVAAGQLAQRLSAHDQARVQSRDLRDSVLTNVETLAFSVRRLAQQLDEARKAVALYARSVTNEETRRQLGTGTLIDVINVSDRLLSARLNLNSAQLGFAVAVAQLRLATGTLTRPGNEAPSQMTIDLASLTQVPR